MNILLLDWNAYGNMDIEETLKEMGHRVDKLPYDDKTATVTSFEATLSKAMKSSHYDFLFSFNYYPIVSTACNSHDLIYVSWIYDSPHINVYSYTVTNPCNRIFIFDYALYEELHNGGISTVYYLPLAVNTSRLQQAVSHTGRPRYNSDISMVGSLYTEPKHDLYRKFNGMNDYARGYVDGLIRAQLPLYGANIIEGLLNDDILEEMEACYPTDPNPTTIMTPRQLYSEYVLYRKVTAIDRMETLKALGVLGNNKSYKVDLYTNDRSVSIDGVSNQGPVDYYDTMPYVFADSRINLNITLRSIRTGIPLRALDIMGCGGLLMTNYQAELMEYFTPGEDLVIYESREDLLDKIDYYMEHEDERKAIARKGLEKVRKEHNYRVRLEEIIHSL